MFKSLWDVESRMEDYDTRLGIEQHVILPQFSGWWSYLIEAELAARMARSQNDALLRLMKEYPGRILGAALTDEEEPLANRTLAKVGERLPRARALYPARIFLEKNKKPASNYFKHNFCFTIETAV